MCDRKYRCNSSPLTRGAKSRWCRKPNPHWHRHTDLKHVQDDQLRGSSKAPGQVDIAHLGLHGCVATGVAIDPEWSHEESTRRFSALFSDAFLYKDEKSSSPLDTRWFILSKERSVMRVVPNRNPTGADVVKFKKIADNIVTVYIALKKTIPESVYTGWYTPEVVETSSVASNDDIAMGSDDFFDESSSDYNLSKDPDASSDIDDNPAQLITGRYDTRIAPTASKRKRDSLDSVEQEQPVKKLKLIVNRGITTNAVASSSKVPPLFITGSPSPSPSYFRTPSLSPAPLILRASKASECSCLRVSPPPIFVMSELSSAYDATMSRDVSSGPYINPWHPDYQPPCY
ncbi:hypothetical protein K438DRAFT_1768262 [Mycena galopus ATCC 62051]|nr:hypothetical protein K438DRAFT_1768262 [Mycena galopus ATCC 62051]